MNELHHFLAHIAYKLRVASLLETTQAGSGHPTSCLSAADIVAVLFFHSMSFDPHNFENPYNDRFILSKGHASALLYAVWKELGLLTEQELNAYRTFNSVLEGHPTLRFPYSEAATGSLGIGLSIGVGEALAGRMDNHHFMTYVLMGDAEITEGSVWEAAALASFYDLSRLVAIVDCNTLGQSTNVMADATTYAARFAAFGFATIIVDGHDIEALISAFQAAKKNTTPTAIIANTIKGYGIDQIEGKLGYHGKPIPEEELSAILEQMCTRFADVADETSLCEWKPQLPTTGIPINKKIDISLPKMLYAQSTMIATRKAFGTALADLGAASSQIVCLDGDVKNSTYTEDFEHVYPDRFVQCLVAEQNMVSVAVGLERRGKIPFAATFGAFFSRAHDQIRMAAIGTSPLRLVGSHAGVSIGQDGPSQMALEDIALMRTLPQSIVLYPCDAVSTRALVTCMANYHDGISYLRTTRAATPIIYHEDEQFVIGGCKVIREYIDARACIIAAGVTVFEALKAHDILLKNNIRISIIDLYSVKPLDAATISRVAAQSDNFIITVEDHYAQGGIGEAVCASLATMSIAVAMLAVRKLPRSGTPEELRAFCSIDAQAIIDAVTGH